jgi:NAD(P)-dependent dehydrogenase (short-subunit alcohol dehydrogenase family)
MPQDSLLCGGKLALVTGAGTGIGRGVAVQLARHGADVVLSYASSAKGAEEAVDEIKAMGRRALAIQGDLSRVDECRRVVDEGVKFLGGLDTLVNNAGVTLDVPFLETTEDQFNQLYHLNIRGMYFCCQQAVPHLIARGAELKARGAWAGGCIINMSSVHSYLSHHGHAIYASTKSAINGFTRSLGVELCADHIRVNAIAPGFVEVPRYYWMMPNYSHEEGDRWVPWGRTGKPEDIGYCAAFLASDGAEWITGQTIFVDGGTAAKLVAPFKP